MNEVQYATYKANFKIHVGLRNPWKVHEEFKFLAVNTLNLRYSSFSNAPEFTNTMTDLDFAPLFPKRLLAGAGIGFSASFLPGFSTSSTYAPLFLSLAGVCMMGALPLTVCPLAYKVNIKHFDKTSQGRDAVGRIINLVGDDFRIIGGYDLAVQNIETLVHEPLLDPDQNYKRALVNHSTLRSS